MKKIVLIGLLVLPLMAFGQRDPNRDPNRGNRGGGDRGGNQTGGGRGGDAGRGGNDNRGGDAGRGGNDNRGGDAGRGGNDNRTDGNAGRVGRDDLGRNRTDGRRDDRFGRGRIDNSREIERRERERAQERRNDFRREIERREFERRNSDFGRRRYDWDGRIRHDEFSRRFSDRAFRDSYRLRNRRLWMDRDIRLRYRSIFDLRWTWGEDPIWIRDSYITPIGYTLLSDDTFDYDTVEVINKRYYNFIKIKVLGDNAYIGTVSIRYCDGWDGFTGTPQTIVVAQTLRDGESTEWFNLKGEDRCIESFSISGTGDRWDSADSIAVMVGRRD
jgi:hypothetical protein